MSLTILSYMHVLCRRADLVKKNTFLGVIILIFLACALRHCRRPNFLTVSIEIMMAFRSMQLEWYNLVTNML